MEQRFIRTMRVADAALPAGSPLLDSIKDRPYSDQYRCWFDADARPRLDDLLGERSLEAGAFRSTVVDAFGDCMKRDYPLNVSKLPVFAAQGTVVYLLRDQQKKRWDACGGREPENTPDPRSFRSDGEVGPSTYALLNGFLACTGRSDNLRIGPTSTAEEYLFVVYAALQELGHG